jgi:GGDEF domain-containing protein
MPRSIADLRLWVREHLQLQPAEEAHLLNACKALVTRQRNMAKDAKVRALHDQSKDFIAKVRALQRRHSANGDAAKEMVKSFEDVLAELADQSRRDPKTTLLHLPWFMNRLERFLAIDRRHRWFAVGVVDIADFRWYNNALGHLEGDRIIERVAHILAEQVRSDDLLTRECASPDAPRDEELHARFGGDEFCFLIPDVFGFNEACAIAQRFKTVVERHDWAAEHEALAHHPVRVDVGMVCLQLGARHDREPQSGQLAAELVRRADLLMYAAKNENATTVHVRSFRVDHGQLLETFGCERADQADYSTPLPQSAARQSSRFHWNPRVKP